MSNFNQYSDQELHQQMVNTSAHERELTLQMISLIEEASRRKYYLSLGFGTIYEYLTQGLKYSAGAAMRRLASARILREIPQVKEQILEGSLTLSHLSQAEQFFRSEAKQDHEMNTEEKKAVLKQIEGQSARETERTLIQLSSSPDQFKVVEKIKPVTPNLTQISFGADEDFMKQLEEARGLLAHRMPHASLTETLAALMELGLVALRKQKFKVTEPKEKTEASPKEAQVKPDSMIHNQVTSDAGNQSRHISSEVKRQVYVRDGGVCVALDRRTGKRCGSKFMIEFDHHPIARALGGPSTSENLRLVCRSCNLKHAALNFGHRKLAC